jgi:hypothetical protein
MKLKHLPGALLAALVFTVAQDVAADDNWLSHIPQRNYLPTSVDYAHPSWPLPLATDAPSNRDVPSEYVRPEYEPFYQTLARYR